MDSNRPAFLDSGCECAFCISSPMPNIYHCNKKLFWVDVPRNASSSMKDTYNWQPITHNEITRYGVMRPIVIYRDPVQRFVSTIDHYFNGAVGRSAYGRDYFQDVLGKDMLQLTPQQRVNLIFESLSELHKISQRHHFFEQVNYLATDYFSEYVMIPLAEASKILNIAVSHRSVKIIGLDHFSTAQVKLVKDIYSADYEFFNIRK